MATLLLDRTTWDLVIDANTDIAVAEDPYAMSQDVCSACLLVSGELWYDTTKGVKYLQQLLNQPFSGSLFKTQFESAALTVAGVTAPTAYIGSISGRKLVGQMSFTATSSAPNIPAQRAAISWVGDNGLNLVFVGDIGGALTFYGMR